ncbi:hypothetical protein [Taklimakanibacter lacteus]|uniref:hypothetical protein n=1 Tax=Taklimakanibacter lacteus TaxID=2268456 RepID=UPI000E66B328
MSGISSDEIRQLVRDALRELLPGVGKARPETGGGGTLLARLRSALLDPKSARVDVKLDTAADLRSFARDLLQAPEDIKTGILSGRIELGIASQGAVSAAVPVAARRSQHQISKGVVTEIMVAEIGKSHDRLVIGKGVVVTPLARDRAREVKLEIVRDRS